MSHDPDVSDLYPASFISNGSEDVKDETDTGLLMDSKTSAVLEKLGNKIVRVRDLIRLEQKLRDGMIINFFNCSLNALMVTHRQRE